MGGGWQTDLLRSPRARCSGPRVGASGLGGRDGRSISLSGIEMLPPGASPQVCGWAWRVTPPSPVLCLGRVHVIQMALSPIHWDTFRPLVSAAPVFKNVEVAGST